ncbi:MAG: Zn-ribbon domain-containing OB-fold protein [Acidimicrobiia bacterium]
MSDAVADVPKYLIPRISPEAAEYFAGTVRGELRLQRCGACGLHHHYPRIACPHCGSDDLTWVTASGLGTVHSFTVIRQNGIPPFHGQVPFVVALVELDEPGARMLAQLPTVAPEAATIGQRVRAVYRPASERVAFVDFEPSDRG